MLASVLVALVIFQALLGMWTVTLLLKPAIVLAHLLGGMATLALLAWLALRQGANKQQLDFPQAHKLRAWAWLGLMIVFAQIVLGGWVSSNYAALACADFPMCQGRWLPAMDFSHAFHFTRDLGMTASGTLLPHEALTAMHWTHRVGALVTFLYVGGLSIALLRNRGFATLGTSILGLLLVQLSLGISNVLFSLPLPVAVAHNGVAALLLIALVVLNFRINLNK